MIRKLPSKINNVSWTYLLRRNMLEQSKKAIIMGRKAADYLEASLPDEEDVEEQTGQPVAALFALF